MPQTLRQKLGNSLETSLLVALVLALLLFILWPLVALFYHTLFSSDGPGLAGALKIIQDSGYLLKNSLLSAALCTLISSLMSLIVGLYSALCGKRLQRLLKLILLVTMISPPFVTALSYINLFGRRGLITYRLLHLSWNPYGMWGVVLIQALSYLSLHALFINAAVERIDPAEINSARDLGAKTGNVIKDIIFPHLRPALAIVALLNFIKSLADFSTPTIIGGNFSTLATESYLNMVAYGNIGKASVLNILIFLPSLLVYIVYRRFNPEIGGQTAFDSAARIRPRGLLYRSLAVGTALLIGTLLIQYGSIISEAFIKRRRGVVSFTLDHFSEAAEHLSGAMTRSIIYALIAALVGTSLGLLLGYALKIRKIKGGAALDFLAVLPYVLPGSFFGIAYIYAFRSAPLALTGTAAIVILNILFKQFPFSAKVGSSAVADLDPALPEAIRDLGGGRWQVLKDGVFAHCRGSFFVGFVNNFSASMTTVGSIFFLVYPGQKVATIVLFDVIQSGIYNVGSAIALWIMAVTVGVNLCCYALLNAHGRRRRRLGQEARAERQLILSSGNQ